MRRVAGVIQQRMDDHTIVIRTEDGNDQRYEVRPLVRPRLRSLSQGDAAVLLLDEENQVADVAFRPTNK
jgi:hypothetical protein